MMSGSNIISHVTKFLLSSHKTGGSHRKKVPKRSGDRVSASAVSQSVARTLPVVWISVDGRKCRALVDTGCTDTLVHAGACSDWSPRPVNMMTVNGGTLRCLGIAEITVQHRENRASLTALVVPDRPLGMDVVLGMSGIVALGGVCVKMPNGVEFGAAVVPAAAAAVAPTVVTGAVSAVEAAAPAVTAVAPPVPTVVTGAAPAATAAVAVPPLVSGARPAARTAVPTETAPPATTAAVAVATPAVRTVAPKVVGTAAAVQGETAAAGPVTNGAVVAANAKAAAGTAPVTGAGPVRGAAPAASVDRGDLSVDAVDFTARFSADSGEWTVAWKWTDGEGPDRLHNTVAQYKVPDAARPAYDEELELWAREGWLRPYDERVDGPARGLIPLMAVEQPNKDKVRPVLDYRELNRHVTAHTADAEVCAEQLRRWRRHGSRLAVLDLRKAYMQLRLDRRLWPYHTVRVRGQLHCLQRMSYGLNVAPNIMRSVVRTILEQNEAVSRGVLPYVDDLLVNEDVISAEQVAEHFSRYGLVCKPPQRPADGARMLGLQVSCSRSGELQWRRDNPVGAPPEVMTRRALFAWCGQLVSHLPVAGWLRPAAAWLKRRANALSQGWDDPIDDPDLRAQVSQVAERVTSNDPARGPWRLTGEKLTVWTDASSLASGVVLEDPEGGVVEDGSWLRPETKAAMHINMAELDAALSGVNMAIAWGIRVIDLRTDSATVHKWVGDALSGRSRLRTKAHAEMLIRRRVDIIRELVAEFQLTITIKLVKSDENPADEMTRVPKEWLRACRAEEETATATGAVPVAAAVAPDGESTHPDTAAKIRAVHENVGHQGVRRTLWYLRRDGEQWATKPAVRAVIRTCDVCQSIDPAPTRWRHGSLGVQLTWERLAIDVTHYRGDHYLTVVDCGPSRYGIWRRLRRSDAAEITAHLETVFLEHGAPAELLLDNATEFRGRRMGAFAARWGVTLRFRAVHEAGGNGIVERHHRTIKVMSARKGCTIAESLHRYNMTPRDGSQPESAPAAGVFRRVGRDLPVTGAGGHDDRPPPALPADSERGAGFREGDLVWVRRRGPATRCTDVSRPGTVTRIVTDQLIEVDGAPWHVRCVRHRHTGQPTAADPPIEDDSEPALSLGKLSEHVRDPKGPLNA
ncbi:hypothetical protein FJT64_005559 [Amphibalanus amphitrite]|uniref:Uncharacterized protein n=1 Tax=Amphibalanus amphitrite TaxID=1232801 RepID=A0A6A4W1P9_AMPAM|nr:hypothetical protein FJT64_005559 [Amphibalanus amphitrite]